MSREVMPVGYELFAGNRADVTTVEEIVTTMENRFGKSDRVWVMDRGMTGADNIEFLKQDDHRHIIGTPRSMLKKYQHEIIKQDWTKVQDGLEVKICPAPPRENESPESRQSSETFILCRSADRAKKEQAMHEKFEKWIEAGLISIQKMGERQKLDALKVSHRVGKLMGANTRAAGAFTTKVNLDEKTSRATLSWSKIDGWREWARLSEGCYLLRSNITNWSAQELWKAYTQLTEAEGAFRIHKSEIHKSDLSLRPIWHQKQERVEAHILACFLSYVLWKTLGQWCKQSGLGDEPRKVLDEIAAIQSVDVILPTRCGQRIRKRCVMKPTEHQAILPHRLGLTLPRGMELMELPGV